MNYTINYTNAIKSLMVLRGLKQADLANSIGMLVTTFNHKLNRKIHKNKTKSVFTSDEIIAIAKTLNVTLDKIFLISEVA